MRFDWDSPITVSKVHGVILICWTVISLTKPSFPPFSPWNHWREPKGVVGREGREDDHRPFALISPPSPDAANLFCVLC